MLRFGIAFGLWLALTFGATAGCGSGNPNCIVPTVQPYTANNNQAASTAFVQGAIAAGGGGSGGITQLTGDVTAGPGTGSQAATVNAAPAGALTGITLNSVVVNSSLTSFGNAPTLNSPVLAGTPSGAGSSITINTTNCPLAGSCTIATGSIVAGSTIVIGGPGVLQNASSGGALVSSLTLPSGLSATNMTLTTPALGTPSAITLTNGTGLPISTGVSGLGSGIGTLLATPNSANLAAALTDETGSGAAVFATSPTLVTPALGTPASGVATNLTGLPLTTGVTGILGLANGGTAAALTASNGGIVYSGASALAILAGTATAGQCMLSGSNAAPTWGSCSGAAAVSSVTASDTTLTISPTTGAVFAALNLGNANTWTAAQTFTDGDFLLKGLTSGALTLKAPAIAGSNVITFPAATDTVSVLGTAQTFTAAKTFTNSDLLLLGSSTGATTFTSANASATNYTLTIPAATSTVAVLGGVNQTFTANETFSGTLNVTGAFQINGNTPFRGQSTPSAKTGTSSLTNVMNGYAGSFTPHTSGNMELIISSKGTSNVNLNGCIIVVAYGTGAAPTNGSAPTGTTVGTTLGFLTGANINQPWTLPAYVTGLTLGTAYWLDVQFAANSGGTCTLGGATMVELEQ